MVEQLSFQIKEGGSIPTSPLQLFIRQTDVHTACKLNAEWHSRLPQIEWGNIVRNRYSGYYGAIYQQKWYAVAIWSSPVNQKFNLNETLELRRFAISPEAPKNTASRMMRIMLKLIREQFPLVRKLLSYQDTEVHNGTIYKASGWLPVHTTRYQPWNKSRQRNNSQSRADKIRWEHNLT